MCYLLHLILFHLYFWFLQIQYLNFSEYTVEKDGRLTIPKVRPDDAGMYVCSANNDLGQTEQPMELVVGGML